MAKCIYCDGELDDAYESEAHEARATCTNSLRAEIKKLRGQLRELEKAAFEACRHEGKTTQDRYFVNGRALRTLWTVADGLSDRA